MYERAIPNARDMTPVAFRRLRDDGMADFREPGTRNVRRVRCRVCRQPIAAGEAIPYNEFMRDGYRFSKRYVCKSCETVTRPAPREAGHE